LAYTLDVGGHLVYIFKKGMYMYFIDFLNSSYEGMLSQKTFIYFKLYLILLFIALFLDILNLKTKIDINKFISIFMTFIVIVFFIYLYFNLNQIVNANMDLYLDGNNNFLESIRDAEKDSPFYLKKLGSAYTTGVIALLGTVFAFLLNLQHFFIKNKVFSENHRGSFFLNTSILLNIFSVLVYIDLLYYSEFKFSELDAINYSVSIDLFGVLIFTTFIIFMIVFFLCKDFIFNQISNKEIL